MLKIKSIKPLSTTVVTTGDKFTSDITVGGIIQQDQKKGDLKLYQKVIAVGPMVRDIQPGDQVMINPMAYIRKKYSKDSVQNDMDNNPVLSIDIPTITIDGEGGKQQECLLLSDRDIRFAFEGEEYPDNLVLPKKKEIVFN